MGYADHVILKLKIFLKVCYCFTSDDHEYIQEEYTLRLWKYIAILRLTKNKPTSLIHNPKLKWQVPKLHLVKFVGDLKAIKPDLKKRLYRRGKRVKRKTEILHGKFVFD